MKYNLEINVNIDYSDDLFVKIKVINPFNAIMDEYNQIMLMLVGAAKLMVGQWSKHGYCYHSFLLEKEALTIIIEDGTKYRKQNANKIGNHLKRVYNVIMSRFGCGNGLKSK